MSQIWIPSKTKAWEIASIVAVDEVLQEVTADAGDGVKTFKKVETQRSDPSHFLDTDDLCSMNHLHEAPLLDCLRRRFLQKRIYTSTGDVLISVNPYCKIDGLYSNMLSFLDIPEDGRIDKTASRPHVFRVANMALVRLLDNSGVLGEAACNQSIVISGESGAGKTETAKHVMAFLTEVDREFHRTKTAAASANTACLVGDAIKKVLLDSNIIFESFGNAKTVRNDNSSRFGKYIKLQYSVDNQLMSAFTETFLLEKSRLLSIGANERNYHIFYEMLSGLTDVKLRTHLRLKSAEEFNILCDCGGKVISMNDNKNFSTLCQALTTIGCTSEELNALWSLLAAILHLGNMSFLDSDQDAALSIPANSEPVTQLTCSSIPIDELSECLLGVTSTVFCNRLVTQRVKVSTRSSITIKMLNKTDVLGNIAALCKWLYSSLFSWLLRKINKAHCSVSENETGRVVKFIGILDIFGFEILQSNSFEQLCINFANERLQQQFNEYVFDREQKIYSDEGLNWMSINYRDNQSVIDLIGKKPTGLLIILEEQGRLNR
jgi:myosin-5